MNAGGSRTVVMRVIRVIRFIRVIKVIRVLRVVRVIRVANRGMSWRDVQSSLTKRP